jgi:hypothetical protein
MGNVRLTPRLDNRHTITVPRSYCHQEPYHQSIVSLCLLIYHKEYVYVLWCVDNRLFKLLKHYLDCVPSRVEDDMLPNVFQATYSHRLDNS